MLHMLELLMVEAVVERADLMIMLANMPSLQPNFCVNMRGHPRLAVGSRPLNWA
jgi:hypothetical protein